MPLFRLLGTRNKIWVINTDFKCWISKPSLNTFGLFTHISATVWRTCSMCVHACVFGWCSSLREPPKRIHLLISEWDRTIGRAFTHYTETGADSHSLSHIPPHTPAYMHSASHLYNWHVSRDTTMMSHHTLTKGTMKNIFFLILHLPPFFLSIHLSSPSYSPVFN